MERCIMNHEPTFSWSDQTDPDIYQNGATIITLTDTHSAILQPFIEEVSHKIGIKLDFRQTCGRYFVMVKKEECETALQRLEAQQIDWSIPCTQR